jgi:hypothetical protein
MNAKGAGSKIGLAPNGGLNMATRLQVAKAEFDSIEELMEHIRRVNPDADFDDEGNGNSFYQMINDIDMPDGEKLVFFDGYCRKCGDTTTHIYFSLSKQSVCTGCRRRIHYHSFAGKMWNWINNPKNGAKNAD